MKKPINGVIRHSGFSSLEHSNKGVIHGAFYQRNTREDTTSSFYGRTQSKGMEIFSYEEGENGSIVIKKTR